MLTINSQVRSSFTTAPKAIAMGAALFLLLGIANTSPAQEVSNTSAIPAGVPVAGRPAPTPVAEAPLTDREKAMMELINKLQERVSKLESAGSVPVVGVAAKPADDSVSPESGSSVKDPYVPAKAMSQDDDGKWGGYTPNLGFKIVDTKYGDLNISIYTYARYLNQKGLDPNYTDAFGNVKNVQNRQDVQLQKLQFKFLGWIMSPKLRYFLYAWTSNANQGLGAQTVLAGNLQYTFNKYVTIGAGIRSLPGTRSVEGNFPFWTNVDSRHIADEFFRPSYTSGLWAIGNITKRLKYQAMLGNNMSTLGVPASRIDNGLNTFSGSLIWFPTGDFEKGFSGQGWGDFEHHDKFSTRVAFHYSRSDENKESQPDSQQFENTQLRLSDGTVIFTPNIFGPGVTVTDARWRMTSFDGGFKYKGFSVEGEYYLRWLDNFRGVSTQNIPRLFDHGFQLQGTAMLKPQLIQLYVGTSKIYGEYGNPWDFRSGINYFPWKNKVVRWNNEILYLYKSPVGYTSVAYPVGARGWVFSSSWELAF